MSTLIREEVARRQAVGFVSASLTASGDPCRDEARTYPTTLQYRLLTAFHSKQASEFPGTQVLRRGLLQQRGDRSKEVLLVKEVSNEICIIA